MAKMRPNKSYAKFQLALEWQERHELGFLATEAAIGLLAVIFSSHLLDVLPGMSSEVMESWLRPFQERAEAFLVGTLVLLILFHWLRKRRRRNLGLQFEQITKGKQTELIQALFALVTKRPLGALVAPENLPGAAKAIASVSASVFSLRTAGTPDGSWQSAEEKYLKMWHAACPETIWCLPLEGSQTKCFSVVVPVTTDSWQKIRAGDLPTLLAAADTTAAGYPMARDLLLLAYCVVMAPSDDNTHPPAQRKLLYAAIEHIAYLVYTHRQGGGKVRIVCESANASLQDVLHALGFTAVPSDGGGKGKGQQSPAGFLLFECAFDAHPASSAQPANFEELVNRVAQLFAPAAKSEEHTATTPGAAPVPPAAA
jgi:hypothetical protein